VILHITSFNTLQAKFRWPPGVVKKLNNENYASIKAHSDCARRRCMSSNTWETYPTLTQRALTRVDAHQRWKNPVLLYFQTRPSALTRLVCTAGNGFLVWCWRASTRVDARSLNESLRISASGRVGWGGLQRLQPPGLCREKLRKISGKLSGNVTYRWLLCCLVHCSRDSQQMWNCIAYTQRWIVDETILSGSWPWQRLSSVNDMSNGSWMWAVSIVSTLLLYVFRAVGCDTGWFTPHATIMAKTTDATVFSLLRTSTLTSASAGTARIRGCNDCQGQRAGRPSSRLGLAYD
jgi:hypothetical protein